MSFRAIIYHVYLGESDGYAWCGRNVGFHTGLFARREAQLEQAAGEDKVTSYCKSCIRSIAADEDERSASVRAALSAYREPAIGYGYCWAADRTEVAEAGHRPVLPTAAEALTQYHRDLLLHEIDAALAECESDFAESQPQYWAGLRGGLSRARRMVESMIGEPTQDEKDAEAAATRARDRELDQWAMTHGEQRL